MERLEDHVDGATQKVEKNKNKTPLEVLKFYNKL